MRVLIILAVVVGLVLWLFRGQKEAPDESRPPLEKYGEFIETTARSSHDEIVYWSVVPERISLTDAGRSGGLDIRFAIDNDSYDVKAIDGGTFWRAEGFDQEGVSRWELSGVLDGEAEDPIRLIPGERYLRDIHVAFPEAVTTWPAGRYTIRVHISTGDGHLVTFALKPYLYR